MLYGDDDDLSGPTWLANFIALNTRLDFHPFVGEAPKPCGNPGTVGWALACQWFSLSSN